MADEENVAVEPQETVKEPSLREILKEIRQLTAYLPEIENRLKPVYFISKDGIATNIAATKLSYAIKAFKQEDRLQFTLLSGNDSLATLFFSTEDALAEIKKDEDKTKYNSDEKYAALGKLLVHKDDPDFVRILKNIAIEKLLNYITQKGIYVLYDASIFQLLFYAYLNVCKMFYDKDNAPEKA